MSTDKSNKANRKNKKKAKISYTVKPEGLTPEAWQIALRKQAATMEKFGITAVDEKNEPGSYFVTNPSTRSKYKVVYRGASSPWNYCSCMDFKTSQLGTCKHIEAVKYWLGGRNKLHREIPPYTSVYVDYRRQRKVRIRIGSDHQEEFHALATKYFDEQFTLKEETYAHFDDFLREARAIDETFRCYSDALEFVIEHRDRLKREKCINDYTDVDIDSLIQNATLYPYQREGVRFACKAGRAIIADEMGLGKTVQAIASAEWFRREKRVSQILVVCPSSLKYQWKREIERFTGADVLVIEGNALKRKEQYAASETYKIVSYNAMSNDVKFNGKLVTDLLIMDEVQRLKNWKTQIAIAARRIESTYSVILSGTPLENKLEELFSVVELADQFCLGPYYQFRDKYILQDESGKVIGYKNLNEISRRLLPVLKRRRKKDVKLQMPQRTDNIRFVEMTHEQRDMHDDFKSALARILAKWRKYHFLTETDRRRMLLLLSQMRMVCDSTYILDQKSRNDTKIDEVMSIIDGIVQTEDEKIVVFSQWERMTRLVAQEMDKRGICYEYLNGSVPSVKRKDMVNNFTDLPECRVFLTTDAGSTGLNLQVAATIVNLDLPWNPAVLEQRIARIYRIGQQNNIQVINLVAPRSIEETMIGKLRFKSSMFEGALDGGDDMVFLDDDKFKGIVETVSEMMEEEEMNSSPEEIVTDDKEENVEEVQKETLGEEALDDETSDENELVGIQEGRSSQGRSSQGGNELEERARSVDVGQDATPQDEKSSQSGHDSSASDLISAGVKFLTGMASVLKTEEGRDELMRELVRTDEQTGKTSINIPVPDKQTVKQLLDVVAKLLG